MPLDKKGGVREGVTKRPGHWAMGNVQMSHKSFESLRDVCWDRQITVLWVLEWRLIFNSPAFWSFNTTKVKQIYRWKRFDTWLRPAITLEVSALANWVPDAKLPLFIKSVDKPNLPFCFLPTQHHSFFSVMFRSFLAWNWLEKQNTERFPFKPKNNNYNVHVYTLFLL